MPGAVQDPPGYPREWEAEVLLADGGVARLRPIRPSDADLLVAFYDRVSPESKRLRFFAPYPRLSARDVQRFTQVDYVDRVALILTLADEIIGVGRYDRTDSDHAEVAFLVEDAHQGRGIAQLLLEHLAEAARERGITGFVAEVLPENRRMVQVFADAGYRVSKGVEDGVVLVEFPILPTTTFVGVMERREHRAESASVRRLLTPRRLVLQGVGERVQELADAVRAGGYRGDVVAVSTDGRPVSGVTTVDSIAAVSGRFDLAVLSVPSTELAGVVIDAAHAGAHGIVVLTGTEYSPADNRTAVHLARAYGLRALGPDALGLVNTHGDLRLNATPGPMPRAGGVGMFCQSAAVGVALLNAVARSGLGLSSFVSTGEYADVSANDVMQYWEDDEDTRVCLLSLDTVGNPRKFSRIVRRLARRKPVVVVAPGRTSRSSHAGVRGGLDHAPEEAVDALFRQAGVMVVHSRGAMLDIATVAARQPLPAGLQVRVVANSATLAGRVQQSVRQAGMIAEQPPVLLGAAAGPADFVDSVRQALADPAVSTVLVAAVNVFAAGTDDVITALESLAADTSKPLVGVFLDFHPPLQHAQPVDRPGSLPRFDNAGDAVRALAALSAYAHWLDREAGAVPLLEVDTESAKRLVNRVLATDPGGRELTDDETGALLHAYGVDLVPHYHVRSLDEAAAVAERLGWSVVLKATGEGIRGRPDLGTSVYRNLDDPEELAEAWEDLHRLVADLGLPAEDVVAVAQPVIQRMAPPGVALVLSSREDAAFGPIISLGLDGIASELLGDTVYRVPPLTTADAAAMVRDLRAAPTLFGRHGAPGVDVAGIEDLLHRLARMADEIPQLASVTLRPCVASYSSIAVLGARILTAPTADQRDPLARTL